MKKGIILILCISVLAGCKKKESFKKSEVVAVIGGEVFTIHDLNAELSLFSRADLRELGRNQEKANFFVNSLIDRWRMYVYAKKKGMDEDPSYQAMVRSYATRLLQRKLMEKYRQPREVSFEEVKEYYHKVKEERYASPERVRVRQINVKTEKEIKEVLEKLKRGEDFGKLAGIYNIDERLRKNKGDLGYLGKGVLPPEVEEVVDKMSKPLQISPPIKARNSYFIVQYLDRMTKSYIPIEKVYDNLVKEIIKLREEKAYTEMKENLEKDLKGEINYELISKQINDASKSAGLIIGPRR